VLTPSIFSGGLDFKIVDRNMVKKMEIFTKLSPTYKNNPNLKPFSLDSVSDTNMLNYRYGMASTFNFEPFVFRDRDD
jgi:hypothetical protein